MYSSWWIETYRKPIPDGQRWSRRTSTTFSSLPVGPTVFEGKQKGQMVDRQNGKPIFNLVDKLIDENIALGTRGCRCWPDDHAAGWCVCGVPTVLKNAPMPVSHGKPGNYICITCTQPTAGLHRPPRHARARANAQCWEMNFLFLFTFHSYSIVVHVVCSLLA